MNHMPVVVRIPVETYLSVCDLANQAGEFPKQWIEGLIDEAVANRHQDLKPQPKPGEQLRLEFP